MNFTAFSSKVSFFYIFLCIIPCTTGISHKDCQYEATAQATNQQTVELKPALLLDRSLSFKKGYRNVVVLKKMTFPNDKVLSIELSEKQISGRTISLKIDYEDVLSADSFDSLLLREQ